MENRHIKRIALKKVAQSTIEFTFVTVVIVVLIYGMIRIFRWVGMDLAERRYESERQFSYQDPATQTKPDFYRPKRMMGVYQNGL